MKPIPFFLLLCVLTLFKFSTQAEELSENNRKFNLAICAIFQNEELFLREWIEYGSSRK
jgi:hypothetical protein